MPDTDTTAIQLRSIKRQTFSSVARMYIEGVKMWDIARALGIRPQTVRQHVDLLERYWRVQFAIDLDQQKRVTLAKLDYLEAQYWEGWHRSLKDAEENTTETKPVKIIRGEESIGGGIAKARRTRKSRDGHAQWLQGVERCIEMRMKILGLAAPERHDVRVTGGVNVSALSDAELMDMVEFAQATGLLSPVTDAEIVDEDTGEA